MDTAVHAVEYVGAVTLRSLRAVGRNSRFVVETIGGFRDVSTWPEQTIIQARRLGVDSLPIALFIAVFTGIVLALLASYSFTGAVPLYFVGTLVEKTVTLELAPVLTGLALGRARRREHRGRVGNDARDRADRCARDARLRSALVSRRSTRLAGVVMFPVVVAAAMVVGVAAGWAASVALLHLSSDEFVKGVRLFFQTFDVEYGLVKSASFGVAVTLVGSIRGTQSRRRRRRRRPRRHVGRRVLGGLLILVLDAFWAVTWLLGREATTMKRDNEAVVGLAVLATIVATIMSVDVGEAGRRWAAAARGRRALPRCRQRAGRQCGRDSRRRRRSHSEPSSSRRMAG